MDPAAELAPAAKADDYGPLGRVVACPEDYSPALLVGISRMRGRSLLGLHKQSLLPFLGVDVWSLYEASWLDGSGKPRRLLLELVIACTSPNLVESKSLKLYLNSLNFKRFASDEDALDTIKADVGSVLGGAEHVVQLLARELYQGAAEPPTLLQTWWDEHLGRHCFSQPEPPENSAPWQLIDGESIGDLPDEMFGEPDESLLRTNIVADAPVEIEEALVTHLLRTLCPCTSQPDWGSLLIKYVGEPIDRAGLLRYVCMMRREVGFHENAVEKVFLAIKARCQPKKLQVTGRFMRRGGIDINPTRAFGYSTESASPPKVRVPGQ